MSGKGTLDDLFDIADKVVDGFGSAVGAKTVEETGESPIPTPSTIVEAIAKYIETECSTGDGKHHLHPSVIADRIRHGKWKSCL